MRPTAGRLLPLSASGALAISAVAILPSLDLLVFVGIAALYTGSGWPLARWLVGDAADRVTRTFLALTLGYLAGATIFCTLRLVGVSSPYVVLSGCAALGLILAARLRTRQEGIVPLAPLGPDDRIAAALLALIAVAVVGPVFARVGEVTSRGLAYRSYFNADLFAHMSVVAELAKGASPPLNPFYPTEALPYYWTYFTLPGLFSQIRSALPVDPAIMLTDLCMAVTFVGVAFVVVRNLGASTWAAAAAWTVILLASSFEGSYYIWRQWSTGRPLAEFEVTNIDAITRWFWNLPGVDGYHRGMWWTPQHMMGLTLGLIALLTMVRAKAPDGARAGLTEGFMLGGSLAVSSFIGIMLVAWYALTQVVAVALERRASFGRWVAARSIAAGIVVGYLGVVVGLGMVQSTPNAFVFGWNRYFFRDPWTFIAFSFGPALFFGPLGLAGAFRASRLLVAAIGVLLTVSTVVFLQLDLRGHENTQVTFRTAQLTYLCLGILLAFAIDSWRARGQRWSRPFFAMLTLAAILAFPTVALDWYNARDISNIRMNPGRFPWTIDITPDDQAAVRWIQRFVPPDAIVQPDAGPRERNTWAFIPAFAKRRMATGNALFTLNPERYVKNMDDIHLAFAEWPADEAHSYFKKLGVDYVYVGDVERLVNGDQVKKFSTRPDRFDPVYRRGSVEIFKVVH
jgi:hypothetical protein